MRELLLHTSAASAVLLCMSVSGARRKASWEAYVCSLYMLRAKRGGATQAEARRDFRDLTHTTVQHSSFTTCAFSSSVMDLRGFNASFGVFMGFLWFEFFCFSCFLFGFFMVWIWNVVSSSPLSPLFFVPFILDSALPPLIACVCTTYSSLCPVVSRCARCQLKD